jgi:hypothetical protein
MKTTMILIAPRRETQGCLLKETDTLRTDAEVRPTP